MLPVAVLVCTAGLVLAMTAVQADWPLFFVYAGAVLAGTSMPPIGACVRARWSYVLASKSEVQTAYALEAVVDEAVFIVGPILVTVLATALHPLAGLTTALVTGLAGTLALAAQRDTAPPPSPRVADSGPRPGMPWRTIVPLFVVTLMLGAFFGSAEVATVAFADERGVTRYAGVLLGLWAAGSLAAGLVTGAIDWRVGTADRVRRGAFALTLVMVPMTLHRVGRRDGGGALRRRLRDRAHADRHPHPDRGDRAARPADRGHRGDPHRDRGRRRPGSDPGGGRHRHRGRLPGLPRRRRGRRPGHPRRAGTAQKHTCPGPEARRRRTPERRSRWRRLGPRDGHRPELIGATTSAGSRRTAWRSTSPSWG